LDRAGKRHWLGIVVAAVLAPGFALADGGLGYGPGALPGGVHVRAADDVEPEPRVSTWLGYGYRGAVIAEDDRHHRGLAGLAFGAGVGDWLAASLRLDGRYDRHVEAPEGPDDGWVGEPRLSALVRRRVTGAAHVGGALSIWFPGDAAPSVVADAISFELAGLASVEVGPALTVSGNLGLRIDRSAAAIDDPDLLSLADRSALGLSEFDAALFGLAVSHRRGPIELAGEWSWDLLYGDGAPGALESPMRLAGTGRYRLADALVLQAVVQLGLSDAPPVARGMPLAPVEPRLLAYAGLQYRFGAGGPAQPIPIVHEPPPPEVVEGALEGRIRSATGGPLPGAAVVVAAGGRRVEVVAGSDGRFTVDALPVGPARVSAAAEAFTSAEAELEIQPGDGNQVELVLEPILPRGQLRGVVRSFAGKPLRATLELIPGGATVTADDAGYFEVDVSPGTYEVVVRAEGYSEQRREVRIEERGVTILNVDLRQR
jgi:hypothetical protein